MTPSAIEAIDGSLTDFSTSESIYVSLSEEKNTNGFVTFDDDLKTAEPVTPKYKPDDEVRILVKVGDPVFSTKSPVNDTRDMSLQCIKRQDEVIEGLRADLSISINAAEHYTLLFNGFSFVGNYGMIEKINSIDGLAADVDITMQIPEERTGTQGELVNANYAWDLGYTGKGQVIAVIDTGIRTTHEAFSVAPPNPRIMPEDLEYIYDRYANLIHGVSEAYYGSDFYISEKVPIGISYVSYTVEETGPNSAIIYTNHEISNDIENTPSGEWIIGSDHGTHVAAIAAGNNGADFKGIAPDSQLAIFKVSGTASIDLSSVLCALEDCVYLGVDVINMSFSAPFDYSSDGALAMCIYADALDLVKAAGIGVCVSAGNEGGYSSLGNYGKNTGGHAYTAYPDNSTIGQPSSYHWPISVASSENALVLDASIVVKDKQYGYIDRCLGGSNRWTSLEGEYEYVYAGLGRLDDYADIDVNDRIALVLRGEISFEDKMQNAYVNGAVGIIVVNNTQGPLLMEIGNYLIPAVSVTESTGAAFIEGMSDNIGILNVLHGEYTDYSVANSVSAFSSIGSTSDMRIKPELTVPGSNITSAIGYGEDDSYESWSGTSMASPAAAGGYALLLQSLMDRFPDIHRYELREIAEFILLSTAKPIEDTLVRSQGAGLMDLASAVTADAYLTLYTNQNGVFYFENAGRPKAELMDSITGEWPHFDVKINPLTNEMVTYNISAQFYIPRPIENGTANGKPCYVTDMTAWDITERILASTTLPKTIEVDPSLTGLFSNTFNVGLCIDGDTQKMLKEYYPNGIFIEGYITLTPQSNDEGVAAASLSLPVLAFYGDWDEAPVIDPTLWWMEEVGTDTIDCIFDLAVIDSSNDAVIYDGMDKFGVNPYVSMKGKEFIYDRISYSPNDDGRFDLPGILTFALLRNAIEAKVQLINPSGNVFWQESGGLQKSIGGQALYLSKIAYPNDLWIFDMAPINEGETWVLRFTAYADTTGFVPDNNEFCSIDIPFTLDLTAPEVYVSDGRIVVKDAHYSAYVNICTDEYFMHSAYSAGIFETERGMETVIPYSGDIAYVFVADYAMNEKSYRVDMLTGEVSEVCGGAAALSADDAEALLYDPACSLCFNTAGSSSWPFAITEYEGRSVAKSTNSAPMTSPAMFPHSTAVLSSVAEMKAGEMLRFEYRVSSENNFDFFRFYVNGERYLSDSGDKPWQTFTFEAKEDGVYRFTWSYEKDRYIGFYEDAVYIDNIYIGAGVEPVGLYTDESMAVTVGHKRGISFSVEPYDAYIPAFTTNDNGIASVNASGIVTGIAEGTAEIRVTAGNLERTVHVTVLPREEYTTLYGHITGSTWNSGYNHDVSFDTDMLEELSFAETSETKDTAMFYADGYFYYTYSHFVMFYQGLPFFLHSLFRVPAERFGQPDTAEEIASWYQPGYLNPYVHMSYNYADGCVYAVRNDGDSLFPMGSLEDLYVSDDSTKIGDFTCRGVRVHSVAFSFANTGLYIIGYTESDSEMILYRVNLENATCTVIGSTGIEKEPYTQSMTYDYEKNTMYYNHVSSSSKFAGLNTIDLATGAASHIGGYGEDGSGAAQICGLCCITNGPEENEVTHLVTFIDGLTGEIIEEQNVPHGDSAVLPAAPDHSGYELLGWRGKYEEITADEIVTAIYAKENTCAVEINGFNLMKRSWIRFSSDNLGLLFTTANFASHTCVYSGDFVDGSVFGCIRINSESWLFRYDLDTQQIFGVYELPNDYLYIDAAYNYSDGCMYFIRSGSGTIDCYSINSTGGLDYVSTIGLTCNGETMNELFTLAISTDGYAYSIERMSNGSLYSIDLSTGKCTFVGNTSVEAPLYAQSLFFDHNTGRMYWAATVFHSSGSGPTSLYEVNYLNAEAALLGRFELEDVQQLTAAYIVPDGGMQALLGDVNRDGKIDADDALVLLRYVMALVNADALDLSVADVNGDGKIDASDALLILRYAIGLIGSLG